MDLSSSKAQKKPTVENQETSTTPIIISNHNFLNPNTKSHLSVSPHQSTNDFYAKRIEAANHHIAEFCQFEFY